MEHASFPGKTLTNGLDVSGVRTSAPGSGLIEREAVFFLYLEILKPWLRTIVSVTVVITMLTLLLTGLALPRWYAAKAIIRSASQEPNTFQQLGISATGFNSLTSSLGSVMGLAASDTDSQEFIGVMRSFEFTTALVHRHNLKPHLAHRGIWTLLPSAVQALLRTMSPPRRPAVNPDWKIYKLMQERFHADFDRKTGNLNLTFVDRSPSTASAVLNYYLEDLRDKLRTRVIKYSRAAAAALEQEIAATEDPLLRAQLDTVLAVQLQQEKTAEVQADFAFTVIDPPVVPDSFSQPAILLDCLGALLLTPLLIGAGIICRERMKAAYMRFHLNRISALSDARNLRTQEGRVYPLGSRP